MHPEVIKSLKTISRLKGSDKIEFLELRQDNYYLKEAIRLTLDPYITSPLSIRNAPDLDEELSTSELDSVFGLINILSTGSVDKHEGLKAVSGLIDVIPHAKPLLFRILSKSLRCGVGMSIANKVWPELVPTFSVAGVSTKIDSIIFPVWGEYCLIGQRIIWVVSAGYARAFSTKGRPIDAPTSLLSSIAHIGHKLGGNRVFDGILMDNHRACLMAGSGVKNVYVITDHVPLDEWKRQGSSQPFESRRKEIFDIFETADIPITITGSTVMLNHGGVLMDENELHSLYLDALNCGLEGLVLKPCNSTYPFDSQDTFIAWTPKERIICDIIKWEGGVDGELLVSSHGRVFAVSAGFAGDEREALYNQRRSLSKKKAEILVQKDDSIGCRFARFLKLAV